MQGLVLRSIEDGPQLEELSVDDPALGEVIVRVAASGICGSDLHVVHGMSTVAVLPSVLGHEASGVVEAIGEGVTSVAPGNHVVIVPVGACQQCANCLAGRPMRCRTHAASLSYGPGHRSRLHASSGDVIAYGGVGSMAELVSISERMVVKITDDVPLPTVAPLGCGVMTGLGAALNTARPEPGEPALVIGCGGVGLNVIQGCALVGAHPIIAVDTNQIRLDLASDFGATHCVNSTEVDLAVAVRSVTPYGVAVAFEVVGRAELVEMAFTLLRDGGTCVVVGAAPAESVARIPLRLIMGSESRLIGSFFGSCQPHRDIPMIIELYRAGRIKLDEFSSHRFALTEYEKAFEDSEIGSTARSLFTMA